METRTIRRIGAGLFATGLAGALASLGYLVGGSIYTCATMKPEKPAAEERLEELENRMYYPGHEIKKHGIKITRTKAGPQYYSDVSDIDIIHGPFACVFEHSDDLQAPELVLLSEADLKSIESVYKSFLDDYKKLAEDPEAMREIRQWREDNNRYEHVFDRRGGYGLFGTLAGLAAMAGSIPLFSLAENREKQAKAKGE